MSLLTRLLLILAALSVWSTVAAAHDIPGAPKDILGTFADSQKTCRAHFVSIKNGEPNDNWDVVIFGEKDGKYTYGDCDVRCEATIQSHRAIKNGYALKMHWISLKSLPDELHVTKRGPNKLRLSAPNGRSSSEIVRCSETASRGATNKR